MVPSHGNFVTVTKTSVLKTFKSWVLYTTEYNLVNSLFRDSKRKKKKNNSELKLFPASVFWLKILTEIHYYFREFTFGMHTNEHQRTLYRLLQISVGFQVSNEIPGAWILLLFWFYNSEMRLETSSTDKEKVPLALTEFYSRSVSWHDPKTFAKIINLHIWYWIYRIRMYVPCRGVSQYRYGLVF